MPRIIIQCNINSLSNLEKIELTYHTKINEPNLTIKANKKLKIFCNYIFLEIYNLEKKKNILV